MRQIISFCFIAFVSFFFCYPVVASINNLEQYSNVTSTCFEPTLGSWYSSSNESRSYGTFGELTTWREQQGKKANAWSPGLDLMAVTSHGRTTSTPYIWNEKSIGIGPAVKYVSQKVIWPWQWGFKLRFLYTVTDGDNSASGYHMNEHIFSLNPYTEYLKRSANEYLWGITAEARVAVSNTKKSTYREDTLSDSNFGNLSLFIQREFSDHVQGRLTLSGLYEGWNKNAGAEVIATGRINESLIIGVRGARIGSATIASGFVGVELGQPLRNLRIER